MGRLLISAFLAVTVVGPAASQSIGGDYAVEGTNFDGSRYSGTATIKPTSATTCVIRWQTGGSTSEGICMRNGDAFSAGYMLNGEVGLVVYKVLRDGSMQGLWTIAGRNGNGTENLTPNSPRAFGATADP